MSTRLRWRASAPGDDLGYELKWALAERLWGQDGSFSADWTPVGPELIPFLEGIIAANRRVGEPPARMAVQAERLIALIRHHGGELEVSLS